MIEVEQLARAHVLTVGEFPFPWVAVCECGWRSRRCPSRAEAEFQARAHLVKVGAGL